MDIYVYIHITYIHRDAAVSVYTAILHLFPANRKWKFVFLSRQTINSNHSSLCQQTCPSKTNAYFSLFRRWKNSYYNIEQSSKAQRPHRQGSSIVAWK